MTETYTADIPGETPEVAADEALNAETPEQAAEEQPDQAIEIPEKFRAEDGSLNAEALLASYRELEQRQSGKEAEPTETAAPTKDDIGYKAPLSEALGTFAEEYSKDGSLSDASYEKLQKEYNVDRAAVDRYIQGEQAIADAATREIFEMAGGKEEYQALLGWVKKTDGEEAMNSLIERLGSAIGAGDREAIRREVGGAVARYKEGTRKGWAPSITGRDTAGNRIQPFANASEMQAAQTEAAYLAGDEAAHKLFDQRLKLSMDMGTV